MLGPDATPEDIAEMVRMISGESATNMGAMQQGLDRGRSEYDSKPQVDPNTPLTPQTTIGQSGSRLLRPDRFEPDKGLGRFMEQAGMIAPMLAPEIAGAMALRGGASAATRAATSPVASSAFDSEFFSTFGGLGDDVASAGVRQAPSRALAVRQPNGMQPTQVTPPQRGLATQQRSLGAPERGIGPADDGWRITNVERVPEPGPSQMTRFAPQPQPQMSMAQGNGFLGGFGPAIGSAMGGAMGGAMGFMGGPAGMPRTQQPPPRQPPTLPGGTVPAQPQRRPSPQFPAPGSNYADSRAKLDFNARAPQPIHRRQAGYDYADHQDGQLMPGTSSREIFPSGMAPSKPSLAQNGGRSVYSPNEMTGARFRDQRALQQQMAAMAARKKQRLAIAGGGGGESDLDALDLW